MEGGPARACTSVPEERIGCWLRLGARSCLQLQETHGGCPLTTGDMKREPYDRLLDEERDDWFGAGLITAVFHPEPIDAPGRKSRNLVPFDPVAVLARQAGWARCCLKDAFNASPRSG